MSEANHDPAIFTFVVGCNRSGTTMLRAMLDSHPELAIPPESYFVIPVLRNAARYERADGLDFDALLADVRANRSFHRNWNLSPEALTALRTGPRPSSAAAGLAALYDCYAREHGKVRSGDKTPQHVLHVELLARSFPDARFVHLIRDGRNVVPSLLENRHGPTRFTGGVEYWRERVLAGRRAGEQLAPGRYHEVRYETLVADPEPTLRAVCEFLDLAYVPDMLEFHTRADELVAGTFDARPHLGIAKPASSTGRDWRITMPDHQVQLFEALAGDTIDAMGYERSGMTPSGRVRLEVVARRAATAAESKTRRLRPGFLSSR